MLVNLTPHTYDEWPVYLTHPLLGLKQGNLNNLTLPKSSHVTKHLPSFDLSTALISSPSEHGGHIPYTYHPYIHVQVDHAISLATSICIGELELTS